MIWSSDFPTTLLWSYVLLTLKAQPSSLGEAANAADERIVCESCWHVRARERRSHVAPPPPTRSRRGSTCRCFSPHSRAGLLNLGNFRKREWPQPSTRPGVTIPATPYDMRNTFVSRTLAAGVTVFEVAMVIGTSVRMIERHYGTLIDGAHNVIANCLNAFETEVKRPCETERVARCRLAAPVSRGEA
jgi:hypothetical protein